MKKISIYLIIGIVIVLLRDNISFMLGNVLGTFKLENNYSEAIIDLKNEEIKYLKNELDSYDEFSKNLYKINYNYKISKIIYKESYNVGKYKVQYGTKDGIKEGMGVINEYGLIGKLTKVNKLTSILTTIKELKDLSVKINESYGKLNYNYELDQFIISDISNYDKVYVNDDVYTSGYGTIKENLYVGKVERIENETISKKIYVKVDNDFNKLNYILIVGDIS